MRLFKRLFSVLPVLVLLAGVAFAQPAGAAGTNHSLGTQVSKCQFIPGYNHAPSPPRLYFGTVVRDTADEDGIEPGPGEMPAELQQQVPQGVSLWGLFFTRSWLSFLFALR